MTVKHLGVSTLAAFPLVAGESVQRGVMRAPIVPFSLNPGEVEVIRTNRARLPRTAHGLRVVPRGVSADLAGVRLSGWSPVVKQIHGAPVFVEAEAMPGVVSLRIEREVGGA